MTSEQDILKEDFLVAMTDLIIVMRDILHRMETSNSLTSAFMKTVERIEMKVDNIERQTIKVDDLDDNSQS